MFEFIANNSIWFIIGFIVIILVIIGYYVDKKGFGIKTTYIELNNDLEKPKEENNKKEKKEIIDMDIPFVSKKKKKTDEDVSKEEPISNLDEPISNLDEIPPVENTKELDTNEEDLTVPFGDVKPQEEKIEIPEENIEIKEEQPKEEVVDDVIELPKEEVSEDKKEESEDVWNF